MSKIPVIDDAFAYPPDPKVGRSFRLSHCPQRIKISLELILPADELPDTAVRILREAVERIAVEVTGMVRVDISGCAETAPGAWGEAGMWLSGEVVGGRREETPPHGL